MWEKIGGFWDYLFIDEVDHEFCYRIYEQGYKIVRRNDVSIKHKIGESFTKTVLGHRFHPTNHSPFRRYFISRNNIIMDYLFPETEGAFAHRLKMLKNTCVSVIVCENEKFKKIAAILKGFRDGKRWCREYTGDIVRRFDPEAQVIDHYRKSEV